MKKLLERERERKPHTLFLLAHSYTLFLLVDHSYPLITIIPFSPSISFLFCFLSLLLELPICCLSNFLFLITPYMREPSRTYKDKNSHNLSLTCLRFVTDSVWIVSISLLVGEEKVFVFPECFWIWFNASVNLFHLFTI